MAYLFKKVEQNCVNDLVYIFKAAYGKDISSTLFEKKLNTSFAGVAYVGFIAYDSETKEPSAFYGVYPCLCDYNDQKYLVAQSGDTMTHPKHQGKGLFTSLALKTYEYCRENNVHLVFGFPNENSYPGFVRKLSWVHFDNMEAFVKKIKTLSWYRINRHLGINNTMHTKWVEFILRKHRSEKAFPSSCKTLDVPTIIHDKAFFEYKKDKNNYLLNIDGLSVFIKTTPDFLYIGDIEYCTEIQLKSVVKKIEKIAASLFIPHVRFQGSTGSMLHQFFSLNYTPIEIKYAVGGVSFTNIIPIEKMKFTMIDNDTF